MENQTTEERLSVLEKFRDDIDFKEQKDKSRQESETAYWQARAEMPSF